MRRSAIVGAMVLGLACATVEEDDTGASIEEQSAAFRAAIEPLQANYERWENSRMADSAVMGYTENAVLSFGNQPVVSGRAAILANAQQMYALGTPMLDLRTQSAMASGDLGVERGTYTFNMTLGPNAPPGMAAMFPDSGSYMAHWHRVNGEWKVAELVVNSMKPLPGMEAMMGAPPARQ